MCARPAKKFAREKSSPFQKGEWQAQYEAESILGADNFDSLAEDERETAGLLLSFACSAEKKNRNGKRQMIISQ